MGASKRSRFGNVANLEDVAREEYAGQGERYGFTEAFLGAAVGAKDLGYTHVTLHPGKRSFPFHFHHLEEEMFYVLSGRALLRQGDPDHTGHEEQLEVQKGDAIAFPPGTGIAHQFINHTDEPFVYLVASTRQRGDVCEYPDSDKLIIRDKELILSRSPRLGYFDGEV